MKKLLFIFLVMSFQNLKAINVICIQRGNQTFIETRLDSAVMHAQNDDIIYLPGGPLALNNSSIEVTKKITFIGCGYNSDSTSATGRTIVGDFTFQAGSDGSMITGIVFSTVTVNSNITITRCSIGSLILNNGSPQTSITENIIGTFQNNQSNLSDFVVMQNVFQDRIYNCNGMDFLNNIFSYNALDGNSTLNNFTNCTFMNNIFKLYGRYCPYNYCPFNSLLDAFSNNNHFQNNIFYLITGLMSIEAYLRLSQDNSEINNFYNANDFIFSSEYHLQPGSVGSNAGSDGTDIGIYGTAHPFKEGGLPFNPHYQLINIPSSVTNQNGTLNVNFQVESQDH